MSAAKRKYLKTSGKFESRTELNGSFRKLPTGVNVGNTSLNQVIEVLVKVRRRNPIRNYIRSISTGKNKPVSREVFDRRFGASPEDIHLVVEFARQHDLTVLQTSVSKRCVILIGQVQKFHDAFQVNLADFMPENGISYRGWTGSIHIPEVLIDIITGVFG